MAAVDDDVAPFLCPRCGSMQVRIVKPTPKRATWATTDCYGCGWPDPPAPPSWAGDQRRGPHPETARPSDQRWAVLDVDPAEVEGHDLVQRARAALDLDPTEIEGYDLVQEALRRNDDVQEVIDGLLDLIDPNRRQSTENR